MCSASWKAIISTPVHNRLKSLLAATQAGIPAGVVVEMIHMFSYDVDSSATCIRAISFESLLQPVFHSEGQPPKPVTFLPRRWTLSGKKHLLYRYECQWRSRIFRRDRPSAKAMLMKTPVDGARHLIGLSARGSSILGYTRMHKGNRLRGTAGTPVMPQAAARWPLRGLPVIRQLRVINHTNSYATAYGTLSVSPCTRASCSSGESSLTRHDRIGDRPATALRNPRQQQVGQSHDVKCASGRNWKARDCAVSCANAAYSKDHCSTPVEHKLAQATPAKLSELEGTRVRNAMPKLFVVPLAIRCIAFQCTM
jgi:hypothetical protein